ncbi:MAG: DUF5777 family beta-barrel protein [Flavobacteriia bacterium]|nr:DUF5777 family beta-barrel protein [Flavobacteriia bacterium]
MKLSPSLLLFNFILFSTSIFSQISNDVNEEIVEEPITFSSTRIINGHSIASLPKGTYEMRIEHRFGDFSGTNGGYQNMFGFDYLSDMRIAIEYGVNDKFMLGLGRSKGTGAPYRSLLDGFLKYKVLEQKEGSMPLSLTVISGSSFTYMKNSILQSDVSFFPKASHRLAYFTQLNLAKHFGERFSLALIPTLLHRNYVTQNDQNTLFALGSAFRLKISSRFAILAEYYHVFHNKQFRPSSFYKNSLGLALEWFTFGHNFTVNFTNSGGLGETQFIPYTTENWLKGQFRFGFCVARKF